MVNTKDVFPGDCQWKRIPGTIELKDICDTIK